MRREIRTRILGLVVSGGLLLTGAASPPTASVKLYALDCGRIAIADMNAFADTGEYAGRPKELISPCFLIRHAKGDLLWDTGIGDATAETTKGRQLLPGYVATVPVTLRSQLRMLGLDYDRVSHFAFSHAHVDHLGNANAMTKALWIVNRCELAWMRQVPQPGGQDASLIGTVDKVQTRLIDGDNDVFGDGSVIILATPGHTPGHQSLLINFPRQQPVILSGDLWHTAENLEHSRVPGFNSSRADTLASMDRVRRIAARLNARIVVQHEIEDFRRLPEFPKALE